MGRTYLARARHTAKLCVIKTLAAVDGGDDPTWHAEAARCLDREAEILAQVEHPHVPRLLEAGRQGDLRYLALEYISGPTLAQRLSHTSPQGEFISGAPIPPAEALTLAARSAATLADLAELPGQLRHLDLKPGNLIIPGDRPAPVLVDFGSAIWARDTGGGPTRPLVIYGTPGYAAPEQYGARGTCCQDNISVGCRRSDPSSCHNSPPQRSSL